MFAVSALLPSSPARFNQSLRLHRAPTIGDQLLQAQRTGLETWSRTAGDTGPAGVVGTKWVGNARNSLVIA